MRKVLLLLASMAFIISMNVCYYRLATIAFDEDGKRFMREWQWLSIGLYSFCLQALMYNCKMATRVERLLLISGSSVLYFTISVIILTLSGLISNPYILIISYNNLLSVLFMFILIASFYGKTFKIGYKLRSRKSTNP